MARFAAGETQAPGRHHGDRGRRRRAGGDRHGDRARRALRARAAAPVARPHRPRRRPLDLPAALQERRSARPPRRGSPSCARPRTASASPRRICACAAKATCSAPARAACPASASRASNSTANISAPRATMPRWCSRAIPPWRATRPGAAPPALSVRQGRGDQADPGGLTLTRCRADQAPKRFGPVVPFMQSQIDQHEDADDGERDQQPPAATVDVMQAPHANREARQEQWRAPQRAERRQFHSVKARGR